MFDIRDHGGNFGAGINKSKPLEVSKTSLTDNSAITVQTSLLYSPSTIVYYDDDYVYSYSGTYVLKHDRKTGVQKIAQAVPTNYTLVDAMYDPSNTTFYGIVSIQSGYFYPIRINISTGTTVIQGYMYATNSYGFAVTPYNVFFFKPASGIYKLPRDFISNNTEYTFASNTSVNNIGNSYYNPATNKLCLCNNTAYWEMDTNTMSLTKNIDSNFGTNGDKSFIMDSSFKYTYSASASTFTKRDIQGSSLSTIYQTAISNVGSLLNYHILSFDENGNILVRGNGILQRLNEATGSVSTLVNIPNYYHYRGFYDVKNLFLDFIQLSGNSYVIRVYEKIKFK